MNVTRLSLGLTLISILFSITLTILFLSNDQRLVYVDSGQLINNYKGMQEARKVYQEKAFIWKSNIDTLTNEIQTQILRYEKEQGKMTTKERSLSQDLIRTKQKQLQEYHQAMNMQAQQEDARMTSEVMTHINSYLKKYGKVKGYNIVMAATQYGNIAYADEGLDVTQDVLEGLNKEYKPK
jgi:outer membrane protein